MLQKITFNLERQQHFDFGFPYVSQTRDDGINHGYLDLKKNPQLIETIPELAGWSELESLIRQLNLSESVFRTVGCDAGVVDINFESRAQKKVGCYVHLAFEDYEYNTDKYYDLIYSGLYYHAEDHPLAGRVHVQGTLTPTAFNEIGGLHNYTLKLDISGLAETETEARSSWEQAMPIISGAFQRINDGWDTYKLSV